MITVYTGPGCVYCVHVKKYLTGKGVTFEEKNINEPGVIDEIMRLTGFMSVPVTTNGKSVSQGWNPSKLVEIIEEDKNV